MNVINSNREDVLRTEHGVKTEYGVKTGDSEIIDTVHHRYIGDEY